MWLLAGLAIVLIAVIAYDLLQRQHAILSNFPVIGHFRYWLEAVGPELRQYIVTDNNEERPFSRDQRRWVYASSKHENYLTVQSLSQRMLRNVMLPVTPLTPWATFGGMNSTSPAFSGWVWPPTILPF